jgi:hypothetical protein
MRCRSIAGCVVIGVVFFPMVALVGVLFGVAVALAPFLWAWAWGWRQLGKEWLRVG